MPPELDLTRIAVAMPTKLDLTRIAAAMPPDVRRGFAPPGESRIDNGAVPLVRALPEDLGQSPDEGRSPKHDEVRDGGAKPRLTSGGGAAAIGVNYVRRT